MLRCMEDGGPVPRSAVLPLFRLVLVNIYGSCCFCIPLIVVVLSYRANFLQQHRQHDIDSACSTGGAVAAAIVSLVVVVVAGVWVHQ